jgi:hypothetical protein
MFNILGERAREQLPLNTPNPHTNPILIHPQTSMLNNPHSLTTAGFTNIQSKLFKVPLGIWPKNKTMKLIGLYMRSVMYDGLQGISMGPFTRGLKWTPEEVELFLVEVRKSLFDSKTHSYLLFHVYYGQKPVDG